MTRHEALLIVNLLTLVNSDEARSLIYRLSCKYVQTLGFRVETLDPRFSR